MPRIGRLFVLLAALGALTATLAPSAAAAPTGTVRLDGVRTTLWTDPATTGVLIQNGVLPLPVGPATVGVDQTASGLSLRYRFPITGGQVDGSSLAGYINHSGGLRFVNLHNGRTLTLTNFRILITANPGLSAIVNGDPGTRVRIANLHLGNATITKQLPTVRVTGVQATLTWTAANALNDSLGVSFFAGGLTLGSANVWAHVA